MKQKKKEVDVTPWEISEKNVDYDKLVKDFGVTTISKELTKEFDKQKLHPLLRRGIYFAHRDFDKWLLAKKQNKKVSIITGRGPSEKMHIGHLIPFFIAKSLQDKFNCEVFIPISDDEKFFVKENLNFENALKYSEDNILDLIALGFDAKKTFIFQDFKYTNIYTYAAQIAKRITYSTSKAVFGLKPENNVGWSFYPAMQAAHILFPQFYTKEKHISLVPVAIDQDPFIRLTRDIAQHKDFNLEKPAAIHAKFMPALNGSAKMSSSDSENNLIYLSDTAKEVETKIKKYAFSGGQETIEQHRKLGGDVETDVSFQYLKMFFEPDDKKLAKIEKDYKSGKLLSGELKQILIEKVNSFLEQHQKAKQKAKKDLDKFLIKN
jgi:tryptophanyl-tRNA synthetase